MWEGQSLTWGDEIKNWYQPRSRPHIVWLIAYSFFSADCAYDEMINNFQFRCECILKKLLSHNIAEQVSAIFAQVSIHLKVSLCSAVEQLCLIALTLERGGEYDEKAEGDSEICCLQKGSWW